MRRNFKFIFPIFILVLFLGLSWVIQILWNAIISPTFSLTEFNYWQAMGLLLFCRILVGGFRFGVPPYQHREKWRNMSEEERAKFKEEWKQRCNKEDKPF